MNTYQALLIFLTSLNEDRLAAVLETVKGEVAKAKGTLLDTVMMDKRMFARKLSKMEAGQYVRLVFRMSPADLGALQARLKLVEDLFRVQIVKVKERAAAPAAAAQPDAAPAAAPAAPEGPGNA